MLRNLLLCRLLRLQLFLRPGPGTARRLPQISCSVTICQALARLEGSGSQRPNDESEGYEVEALVLK